jgi:hypothetical protein
VRIYSLPRGRIGAECLSTSGRRLHRTAVPIPHEGLFVIRNAKQSPVNFAPASWTMPSILRGERSGSGRLPELRRYWICCEARGLER